MNIQARMSGDTFSTKALQGYKNVLRSLLPLCEGNALPEEMFLEYYNTSSVLRRLWGASAERISPFKLL